MKFRKLLAAGLAACSLLTLAACSSDEGGTNWDAYKQDEKVLDSVTVGEGATAGKLTFESIDSDSVCITGYVGPETPHALTIPASVRTSEDTSIPEKKVVAIAARAFHSLSNVKSVTLPTGLEEIGAYAFAECKQLETVTIPTSLKTMGDAAFYGCAKLTDIGAIGSSALQAIPAQCYLECTSLTSVTIPANIKTVGAGAFQNCTGLTSVTVADGVELLGDQCFMNASNVTTLSLPSTLTNTDATKDLVFYGWTKLTAISGSGATSDYAKTIKLAE